VGCCANARVGGYVGAGRQCTCHSPSSLRTISVALTRRRSMLSLSASFMPPAVVEARESDRHSRPAAQLLHRVREKATPDPKLVTDGADKSCLLPERRADCWGGGNHRSVKRVCSAALVSSLSGRQRQISTTPTPLPPLFFGSHRELGRCTVLSLPGDHARAVLAGVATPGPRRRSLHHLKLRCTSETEEWRVFSSGLIPQSVGPFTWRKAPRAFKFGGGYL